MQKLTTGYTMYFNILRDRTGALFQGKFKSEHADSDRYLKYLIAYIHLNPLKLFEPNWKKHTVKNKKAAESFLNNYLYSSYLEYLDAVRPQSKVTDKAALPLYFESPKKARQEMFEWILFDR